MGLLRDKTAVIYGGGGAIGGAMARTFAREGAQVFIAGRTRDKLERVAAAIAADGRNSQGEIHIAALDVLEPGAVARHLESVAALTGRIDVAANAIGVMHVQGPPLAELSLDDFMFPLNTYMRANFLIAQAASEHMAGGPAGEQGSGVILTLSTPGARTTGTGFLGYGVTCGAIETFSRILAGELGASGIRTVCIRADALVEALPTSHAHAVFAGFAERTGISVETMIAERARQVSLLKRGPTLAEIAEFAAFAASDRAGAMTGAIANLTCGSVVD